jgi:hypothetical protein
MFAVKFRFRKRENSIDVRKDAALDFDRPILGESLNPFHRQHDPPV